MKGIELKTNGVKKNVMDSTVEKIAEHLRINQIQVENVTGLEAIKFLRGRKAVFIKLHTTGPNGSPTVYINISKQLMLETFEKSKKLFFQLQILDNSIFIETVNYQAQKQD